MEKKDYFEENIKNLISVHGQEQKMNESRKAQIIKKLKQEAVKNKTAKSSPFYRYRRFAFSAAAVLVLVVLRFYVLTDSEHKIKNPPELAAMSAEQLLEMYYDSTQTTYAPEIVKAALVRALEKLDPENVIEVAQNVAKRGGSYALVGAGVHPLPEFSGFTRMAFPAVVEESNLMVRARLVKVEINVDDIITGLLDKKWAGGEDWMSRYRVTVQLEVLEALPENALEIGQIITVPAVIYDDQLNALKEGTEYFAAMVHGAESEPKFLDAFTGIYPVDYNNPVTPEFWKFFADAQDILLFGNEPSQETINYWAARIGGESSQLALEYMNILPDDLIPSGPVINAIERRYIDLVEQVQRNYSDAVARGEADIPMYADGNAGRLSGDNRLFFIKGMSLLLRADDKDSIKRMLALFDGDIDFGRKSILWQLVASAYITDSQRASLLSLIVRLIIASQDGNLSDRLMEAYVKYKDTPLVGNSGANPSLALWNKKRFAQSLLSEIIDQADAFADEDIESMLSRILDNPSEFGIDDAATMKKIWTSLATSGTYDMRSYLEKFLSEPNLSSIGIEPGPESYSSVFEFELAAFDSLRVLPEVKRPGHKELLSWLFIIYERNKNDDACRTSINNELKTILRPDDTEIAPVLEDFLEMEYIPNRGNDTDDIIINIMHDPNLIPFIREAIDKTPNNSDTVSLIEALYACGAQEEAIAKALEILVLPLSQGRSLDLSGDMYRNAQVLLFLGKTQREGFLPVIEGYTEQEYFDRYIEIFSQLDRSSLKYYYMINFRQKAIMALARLGGQSAIPTLKQLYESPDIRIRIISALALYYNGDTTGEELVRRFVEGTYRDVPEIAMRLGVDMSERDVFQDVISSYLRNDLTDALWLEKLTHNIERPSDRDIVGTVFFKDYSSEILNILVEQLDNKNRNIRGSALEMLRQATGQNFGFDSDRYAGQQEEIVQRWREYIKSTKQ